MRLFLFLLCFHCSSLVYSKGIVIADEKEQLILFGMEDSTRVIEFANDLANSYSEVILHLGNEYVFRRGNIFYDSIHQANLKHFSEALKIKNVQLYLWFLDSYGSVSFQKIFLQHRNIIDETRGYLDRLNLTYTGVYIDLEWINKGAMLPNNEQFEAVLTYLEKSFPTKKIGYFCSLIDSEKENDRRGFTWKKLKNHRALPLVMLYIKDGGFYVEKDQVVPYLNENRLSELQAYYAKQKWNVCVSLSSAWIVKTDKDAKSLHVNSNQLGQIKQKIQPIDKFLTAYYSIVKCQIQSDIQLTNSSLKSKDELWVLKVFTHWLQPSYFEWEYFSIQEELEIR